MTMTDSSFILEPCCEITIILKKIDSTMYVPASTTILHFHVFIFTLTNTFSTSKERSRTMS